MRVIKVNCQSNVFCYSADVTRTFDSLDPTADFIFSHFDSFFSAIFHFHRIDDSARRRSWHLIFRGKPTSFVLVEEKLYWQAQRLS